MFMAATWGTTFFMVKDVQTRVPMADLLVLRWGLAAIVLTVGFWRHLRMSRRTLTRGLILGVLYGAAQAVQNVGLDHTEASSNGFITGLYVVITPMLLAALFGVRPRPVTWAAVGLATLGLGVLSLRGFAFGQLDQTAFGFGEAMTLASAILYAAQIVFLGRWSTPADTPAFSVLQTWVTCVIGAIFALPGGVVLPTTAPDWGRLIYLAVVAGSAMVFLQTWAQARVDPTRAAVIMSAEPVWAAAFAVALGGESVTWRMLIGGGAILAAMYLIEVVPRLIEKRAGAAT